MDYMNNLHIIQIICALYYKSADYKINPWIRNRNTPSKANIMPKFPREMLTPEVRMNIANVIKHMEASHNEATEVMKCMKKLVPTIPLGAFHLILQAMVQPHIMIQCL